MTEKDKTILSSSIENEMMVLGSLLNTPENASIGLKLIVEDDFFEPKHKIILKAIQHVFHEKKVVDVYLITGVWTNSAPKRRTIASKFSHSI
jgi:replicative DNA helicase